MNGTIQQVLLVCAFAAAVRWAEWPERTAAAVALSSHLLDWLYHWSISGSGVYQNVDYGHLTIDLYLLAGFLAIALWADRQWTLWLSAAQIVAVLSHPVRLVSESVAELAYAIMIRAPSWLQIALICGGIAMTAYRRQRAVRQSEQRSRRLRETARSRLPSG